MESSVASRKKSSSYCEWCGREIPDSSRGRKRKYCRRSCRQRAYEQRRDQNKISELSAGVLPDNAVILSPENKEKLQDQLFELRCAAEDIEQAALDGASVEELKELCGELVVLTRKIEKISAY